MGRKDMISLSLTQWERMAEARRLDAATCLSAGRRVEANLKEPGYGG